MQDYEMPPQLEQQLEVLVSKFEKKCRYHLPAPTHLRGGADSSLPLPSLNENTATDQMMSTDDKISNGTERSTTTTMMAQGGGKKEQKEMKQPTGQASSWDKMVMDWEADDAISIAFAKMASNTTNNNDEGGEGEEESRTPNRAAPAGTSNGVNKTGSSTYHQLRHSQDAKAPLQMWMTQALRAEARAEHALEEVRVLRDRVEKILHVTQFVREKNDSLASNASQLMVRKAELERLHGAVSEALSRFTTADSLCREVTHPKLDPFSPRFAALLDEIRDTLAFMAECTHYKSTKAYISKLSLAQQRALITLRDTVTHNFAQAVTELISMEFYASFFENPMNLPVRGGAGGSQGSRKGSAGTGTGQKTAGYSQPGIDPTNLGCVLASLNKQFVKYVQLTYPLLRLLEARAEDVGVDDIYFADAMASYREQRVRVVLPLLKDFLEAELDRKKPPVTPNNTVAKADDGSGTVSNSQASLSSPKETGKNPAQSISSRGTFLRNFTADCLGHLLDLASEEALLFDEVWVSGETDSALDDILSDLSDHMYYAFRAKLLAIDGIRDLSIIADVLNSKISEATLHQEVQQNGSAGSLDEQQQQQQPPKRDCSKYIEALARKMHQDVQERVVFRTSVYIRTEIYPFRYTADEVATYCCLQKETSPHQQASSGKEETAKNETQDSPTGPHEESLQEHKKEEKRREESSRNDAQDTPSSADHIIPSEESKSKVASTTGGSSAAHLPLTVRMFPTVEKCVILLELLYNSVDKNVFAVFAEESIYLVVQILQRAQKLLAAVPATDKTILGKLCTHSVGSTTAPTATFPQLVQLHSLFFLIRNLLQVREQLAHYQVSLHSVEKQLDLSSLAQKRLDIYQKSREAKRDIESELRTACEDVVDLMCVSLDDVSKRFKIPLPAHSPPFSSEEEKTVLTELKSCSTEIQRHLAVLSGLLFMHLTTTSTRTILLRPARAHAGEIMKGRIQAISEVMKDVFVEGEEGAVDQQEGSEELPRGKNYYIHRSQRLTHI